ncbi:F0F1 ATP synthase subunit delta [Parenemella sanctibonifatiensis]|uniref:ATP synthase subunit delta n=1 Tax=Parenemella sanctibonifatiensis TaxID=2016505 RepID=A0A255EB19_9ACTN|nr:F0F1 ATP synthase subunit delta [Parenemella sanctibonifatiensis]OYN86602.1 F0F1 ATP synthase subunit delta [Parenemella sanctibonifatiensis]
MSAMTTTDAQHQQLDQAVDQLPVTATVAGELFAVADALLAQPALRRSLSDPSTVAERRADLARTLFGGKVDDLTREVVATAATGRWSDRGLTRAIERQGVRAWFRVAQAEGQLATVEDELFRFGRVVAGDPELELTLVNPGAALDRRRGIVERLLTGRTHPATVALAVRAVGVEHGGYPDQIERYLELSAAAQQQSIATVTVARPLDQDQEARLRAGLIKQTGQAIVLHVVVDPSVVGGIKVELGDEVIDGTVGGRIHQLRQRFS